MRAYRLVKARYVDEVLSGLGASFRWGARWNYPGDRAVYAAENRALAVIETLAHVPRLAGLPPHVMCEIDVPDAFLERPRDAPPASDAAAAAFGHAWFVEQRSVALVVPSVIVPDEANVVINAGHPEASRVQLVAAIDYPIDERLRTLLGKS